jgi:hypothetical protein
MEPQRSEKHGSEYIRVETVKAEILDVPTSTLYRLAADDPTMPVLRLGGTLKNGKMKRGSLLFHRERLIKWLRAREQGHANGTSR